MPGKATIKHVADVDKAIHDLGRLVAKQDEVIEKLKQQKKPADDAGDALGGIVAKIGAFVSLGAAIGKVSAELDVLAAKRAEAAGRVESAESNRLKLLSISGGDADVLAGFEKTAEVLRTKHGFTLDEALSFTFSGTSLGFSQENLRRFGRTRGFTTEPEPLLAAVAGFRGQFGPTSLGGTDDAGINAILAAAKEASIGPTQIAREALGAGVSVKFLGGDPAELLAALSPLAVTLKDPAEASTVIGRFADIAKKQPELKGKGLFNAIDAFSAMSQDERDAILGANIRAEKGFGLLSENRAQIQTVFRSIQTAMALAGTVDAPVARVLALGEEDPLTVSMAAQRRTLGARELGEEERGAVFDQAQRTWENSVRAIMEQRGLYDEGFGIGLWQSMNDSLNFAVRRKLGIAPSQGLLEHAFGAPQGPREEQVFEQFRIAVQALEQTTANLDSAAARMGQTNRNADIE